MWRIKIQLQVKLPIDEDERGDAFWGIPKLCFLVSLDYLGVPWASPSLGSFHSLFHNPSNLYPKLENFTTENLKVENLVSSVSERKQKTTSRHCNELILYLYGCYNYCIPTSLWIINNFTSHRFIKISKQHMKNRICQKQNSLVIWIKHILLELINISNKFLHLSNLYINHLKK